MLAKMVSRILLLSAMISCGTIVPKPQILKRELASFTSSKAPLACSESHDDTCMHAGVDDTDIDQLLYDMENYDSLL